MGSIGSGCAVQQPDGTAARRSFCPTLFDTSDADRASQGMSWLGLAEVAV